MNSEKNYLYLIDGIVLKDEILAFACGPAIDPGRMSSTMLFCRGKEWKRIEIHDDSVVALAELNGACFILGEDGYVITFGKPNGNSITEEDINAPSTFKIPSFAELICMVSFENTLLAAGMDGQLYKFDGINWTAMTINLPNINKFDIQAIGGLSIDDFYLVGMFGWIAHWNGRWTKIDSPTNLNLSSVCVGNDGHIYIAGDNGILLRGVDEKWEIVDQLNRNENIWSIVNYCNNIYATTTSSIFVLKDDKWSKVAIPPDVLPPFNRLFSSKDFLLSIGEISAARFDGSSWFTLTIPDIVHP